MNIHQNYIAHISHYTHFPMQFCLMHKFWQAISPNRMHFCTFPALRYAFLHTLLLNIFYLIAPQPLEKCKFERTATFFVHVLLL